MLLAVVRNKDSLTTLKVALFYQQRRDIQDLLLSSDEQTILPGPVLTTDTLVPMVAALATVAVSKRPHLCEMEEKLVSSLGNCKYTTEMLLAIHSLDRICAGRTPRTP